MGNTIASSANDAGAGDFLPPDYLRPCDLGRADVVFAPIGPLGAGRLIVCLAYDFFSRIIAAGTSSGLVILISDKNVQSTLRLQDGCAIEHLYFLKDGKLFVNNGNVIEIWNWTTGSRSFELRIDVNCPIVYQQRFIIFGTHGGLIEVLDGDRCRLSTHSIHPDLTEENAKPNAPCNGETAELEILSISLDEDCLYTVFSNSTIRLYDLRTESTISWKYSSDRVYLISVEPSKLEHKGLSRFASATENSRISLWNQHDSLPFGTLVLTTSEKCSEPIKQIEWTSDCLVVLHGSISPSVFIYSLEDHSLLSSIPCDIHRLLIISFTSPVTCISSNKSGGLFISQLGSSGLDCSCTLISSEFAQCVLFKCFSGGDAIRNWMKTLSVSQSRRPCTLCSEYLQGAVCPESAGDPNILITVSDEHVMSLWDGTSLFYSKLLKSVNLAVLTPTNFKDAESPIVPSCVCLASEQDFRIAIGFSDGHVTVIEYVTQEDKFLAISEVHVHNDRVMHVQLCSNWDRIASADQHSVCLCELSSGQILFAFQIPQTSCLFFCQIDNTMQCPGTPLRDILLIGTNRRLLFAYDSANGSCVNSEFSPVGDMSLNGATNFGESARSFSTDNLTLSSPSLLSLNDSVLISDIVDSHGCQVPIQDHITSKSIYISPRYLIGSWGSTLRLCELLSDSAGVRINSLYEIQYPYRILLCWIISVELQRESQSEVSAVVTIDTGRRLQIRRLMDISCILLESEIPADIRSNDILRCSCTRNGRLSWITEGGEVMSAVLFMDELRKVQAPVIARIEKTCVREKRHNSTGIVSSISKFIQGPPTEALSSQEPAVQTSSSKYDQKIDAFTDVSLKSDENLEIVNRTALQSENLHSGAAEFNKHKIAF